MVDKIDVDRNGVSKSALRVAAEDQLGKSKVFPSELREKTPEEIIHELRVHQIELEMQNEELKRVQLELEESRDKYQDLYDLSSVGHFTLTHKGLIIQANLAGASLLGMLRPKLINLGFGHFVAPESEDQYYQHILNVRKQAAKQACDLTLKRDDGSSFYARLESIRTDEPVQLQKSNGATLALRIAVIDITDRKKAEDALRESEERFRGMFESHSAVMLLVEPDTGRIVLANNAAERFYGYTVSQLVSMCIQEVNILPPAEVEAEMNFALHQIRTHFIFPHRRADGAVRTVEVHSSPIEHNGKVMLFSIIHDITKRLELEERLRHNQIMLARTERIAQIGSWEWEVATDSVTWSDELFRIFQLDPTRGAPSFEEHSSIYTPDSMARLREAVGLALSDGIPYELELQGIRSDGKTRHLRASGFPERTPDGRTSYLFGSLNDITDRKRFEEERLEMERKLLHTQKLESLGVMAAGIAHDFNNQLAVVLGNLELALTDQTLDPETLLSIESAIGAAKRSAEFSRQMQVYTGNIVYFPVDLDLNEFLNRNLAQLKSIVSKHVALNFETNSTLPIVKGDAEQLQRLVMNILVNASEAIADKDGNVTLRTGVLECDLAYLGRSLLKEKPAPGPFVFLEVTDTGCGMDVMTQHRIFDPFFTTKFCGRGLGMAEVIGIVKSHRGAIMVESEIGKGTAIRVLFPVSKEAQPSSVTDSMVSEPKDAVSSTAARRKTILVVEDEAGVRDLVVRRLDLLGYDSIIAEDGEEGVSVFRERMNKIDLVMLDYKMPKMNGVEAFGELIRIKPDVKVILSSGYTENVVMKSFPGQRPACVLHKPYNMADLKAQLDILLGTDN